MVRTLHQARGMTEGVEKCEIVGFLSFERPNLTFFNRSVLFEN